MILEITTSNNFVSVLENKEDGTLHRYTVAPGDPYDHLPQAVQDACMAAHTPEAIAEYQAILAASILPAPEPAPNYSAAWADLITSPLYQRALGLAFTALPVNTAMTTFGIAFQAHRDLPHEVWAGALSASAGHLAAAINATPEPLTEAERLWVDDWNIRHNLDLTLPWEALNG